MLICKLAGVLSSRKITITELSDKIGVSRTALSQLVNNTTKGIQYDTLNRICNYLKLTPNDVLMHYPLEIYCNEVKNLEKGAIPISFFDLKTWGDYQFEYKICIEKWNRSLEFYVYTVVSIFCEKGYPDNEYTLEQSLDINVNLNYSDKPDLRKILESVPVEMKHVIDNEILLVTREELSDIIDTYIDSFQYSSEAKYNINVEWS